MARFFEFATNHAFLFLGLVLVTVLLLQDLFESVFRKYKVITPTKAVTLLDQENTKVIDVREAHEYRKGHIQDAHNIPFNKLKDYAKNLESFKHHPVMVTCQSGTRSPAACKELMSLGFDDVYLLKGGMQSWEDINLPIQRK